MSKPWFLLLPLAWSVLYALGSMLLKRALDSGAGALRIAFLNNVMVGVLFMPGILAIHPDATWEQLRWPLLTSLVYFAGQVCTFVAMRVGDVSVLTPAMGVKVVFVAICMVIWKTGPVPASLWVGSFLAAGAVFLLGMSDWRDRVRVGRTAALAVVSAMLYAVCDLLTQTRSPELGALAFAGVMLGAVALESLLLMPFFREPISALPRAAWPWALSGAFLIAGQSGGMALTLGTFGEAAAVNIVYSTRGLWSVLLVWLAGSWFASREQAAGRGVLARRLAGALLLLVAVGMVLLG